MFHALLKDAKILARVLQSFVLPLQAEQHLPDYQALKQLRMVLPTVLL
jgi:hypothetical protein